MYGFPGETVPKMYETLRFSLSLRLDRAQYAIFVPYPGTVHYKKLADEGRIPSWDKFKIHCAYFAAPENRAAIRFILIISFFLFFIRPRIFRNLMSEIISPSHLLYIIKRWFIVWLGLL